MSECIKVLNMNISTCGTQTRYQNGSAENVTCLLAVSAYCADVSKHRFCAEMWCHRHVSMLLLVAGMWQGHLHAIWGLPSQVQKACHLFNDVTHFHVPLQDPCTAVACCKATAVHGCGNYCLIAALNVGPSKKQWG